jgi:hypothetical protein
MTDLHQLVNAVGLVNLLDHGSGSLVYSEGCAGVTQQDLERLVALMRVRVAELEAVHEDASGAILQAVEAERERVLTSVEDRLRGWRQRKMNRSGDMLALDDFMGQDSIEDLVDHVCDRFAP